MIPLDINGLTKLEAKQDVTRACLFNIIVYTTDSERTNYFNGIVKMIAQEFPCHIIFIQTDLKNQDSYLKVSTSSTLIASEASKIDPSCSQMMCDQILIQAAGNNIQQVPYLILPLFIPDLPIYLIWGDPPSMDNIIFKSLKPFVKRIIFDSETTVDLAKFAKNVLEELEQGRLEVVDMNWARIGGWRDVLSQTFDSPKRIEQLSTATTINIIYNVLPNKTFPHPASRSIYLQAWLASRLNWQFKQLSRENNTYIVKYQTKQGIVDIHLIPETHESFSHEEIIEIEISGPSDYDCHLVRIATHQIRVHSSNQYQCQLPFNLLMPTLESGRSFVQEIFYHKSSAQYPPSLEFMSQASWS